MTRCWLRPCPCESPRPVTPGDINDAIEAVRDHLSRGGLTDGLVYDAVRARLIEVGEAVKDVSPELLGTEPDIPWKAIARMRDHLAHRYFDTDHAIVQDVVHNELDRLEGAVRSLLARVDPESDTP